MTKQELTSKAQAGEMAAILQLIELLTDEKEWNEAIDWADKAAETYNENGLYKAAILHHFRLYSLLGGGAPFYGLMEEDAQAVQKDAGVLVSAAQAGLIELSADTLSLIQKFFDEACYGEALVCCVKEKPDYDRVIHLLKEANSTKEKAICGLACYQMQQDARAAEMLKDVYLDADYVSADKMFAEQCIYAAAMQNLSVIARMDGKMGQAVAALNRGRQGVSNEALKEALAKELARYQKKLFGGWKYN